jgi:hypothetical protein
VIGSFLFPELKNFADSEPDVCRELRHRVAARAGFEDKFMRPTRVRLTPANLSHWLMSHEEPDSPSVALQSNPDFGAQYGANFRP